MKPQLTIKAFAEFCEKKPADETYEYLDCHDCAYYQFLIDRGFPVASVGGNYWTDTDEHEHEIIHAVQMALVHYPRTFGDLVQRLRDVL